MKSLKQISYIATNITTEHAINMQELCLIHEKSSYKVPSKLLKAKRNIGDFPFSGKFNRFKEDPIMIQYKQYARSFRSGRISRRKDIGLKFICTYNYKQDLSEITKWFDLVLNGLTYYSIDISE